MSIKPDPIVSHAIAQSIVDRALSRQNVVSISKMHGGEIAAVYEIVLAADQPPLILKAYRSPCTGRCGRKAIASTIPGGASN
jgi:hygromycin-B 7''-O-kinase